MMFTSYLWDVLLHMIGRINMLAAFLLLVQAQSKRERGFVCKTNSQGLKQHCSETFYKLLNS